jgi:hypothetical protein
MKAQRAGSAADAAAPQFTQTNLFEYKLYALKRRTDVADNETKQIELTAGRDVPARKTFIYDGLGDEWRSWFHNYSYRGQGSFGQQSNPRVGVFVTFRNSEKGGLGMPLPKGKVRVYKRDDDGREQFIGEDQIDHTPKDEEARLYLGMHSTSLVSGSRRISRRTPPGGSWKRPLRSKCATTRKGPRTCRCTSTHGGGPSGRSRAQTPNGQRWTRAR